MAGNPFDDLIPRPGSVPKVLDEAGDPALFAVPPPGTRMTNPMVGTLVAEPAGVPQVAASPPPPVAGGFDDPQQYIEGVKGIVPGAIKAAGTTLQAPDVYAASAQQGAAQRVRERLDILDRADRGEQIDPRLDVAGYGQMTPEQRANARAGLSRVLGQEWVTNPTPIQDRTLFKAGEAVQDFAKTVLPAAPGYEKAFGREVGEGGGSLLFGLPFAFLGTLPAAAVYGSMGVGEATQRAVEFDRKEKTAGRQGLTQDQITTAGLFGIGPGMTDVAPVEVLLGRLPIRVPEVLRRPLAQGIARIGIQATIEGIQEGGQGFLQDLIAREVYNPSQVLGENFEREAQVGGAVGGIAEFLRQLGTGVVRSAAGRRGAGQSTTTQPAPEASPLPQDQGGPQLPWPSPAIPESPPAATPEASARPPRARRTSEAAPPAAVPANPFADLVPENTAGSIENAPWVAELAQSIADGRRSREPDMEAGSSAVPGVAQPDVDMASPVGVEPDREADILQPGLMTSVVTPDGSMEIEARPEIVEIDDLRLADGGLQPRDRSRAEYAQGVRDRASRLDPLQLQPSRVSDTGAPIVMPDGTVLSGNGRTMSIAEVYDNPALASQASAYRASLGQAAEGMRRPVLVMRAPNITQDQAVQFADRSNRGRIAQMSATERAIRDAQAIGPAGIALYTGGDFTAQQNRRFLNDFMTRVVTSAEMPSVSRGGELTQEGVARMRAAVLAAAYGDQDVLARVLESTDDNVRAITSGLLDAAPGMAQLRAGIASGEVAADMDAVPALMEAVRTISDLRSRRVPVQTWLAQTDAFGRDPVVEAWVKSFYYDDSNRAKRQEKIAALLNDYATEAMLHRPGGLFADETTSRDVLGVARRKSDANEAEDLFASDGGVGQGVPAAGRRTKGRADASGSQRSGQGSQAEGAIGDGEFLAAIQSAPNDRSGSESDQDNDQDGDPSQDWQDAYFEDLARTGTAFEMQRPDDSRVDLGRPAPKTAVELESDRLMKAIGAREAELRRQRVSAQDIASTLTNEFGRKNGFTVTPDQIETGKVWWRIGDIMNIEMGKRMSWTPHALEMMQSFLNENNGRLSYPQIASKMSAALGRGITKDQVEITARRYGLKTGRRARTVGETRWWTPQRNYDLARLYLAGLNTFQITNAFNKMHGSSMEPKDIGRQLKDLRVASGFPISTPAQHRSIDVQSVVMSGMKKGMSQAEIADILSDVTGKEHSRGSISGIIQRFRLDQDIERLAQDLGITSRELYSDYMPDHVRSAASEWAISHGMNPSPAYIKEQARLATRNGGGFRWAPRSDGRSPDARLVELVRNTPRRPTVPGALNPIDWTEITKQLNAEFDASVPLTSKAVQLRWGRIKNAALKAQGDEPMFAADRWSPRSWLDWVKGNPDVGRENATGSAEDTSQGSGSPAGGQPGTSQTGGGRDASNATRGNDGINPTFRVRDLVGRVVDAPPNGQGLGQKYLFLHGPNAFFPIKGSDRTRLRILDQVPNWQAKAHVSEVEPGVWQVRSFRIRKAKAAAGLSTEFLDAIQQQLGDILPPDIMTPASYSAWNAWERQGDVVPGANTSITGYVENPKNGQFYRPQALRDLQRATAVVAQRGETVEARNRARREYNELSDLVEKLPPEDDVSGDVMAAVASAMLKDARVSAEKVAKKGGEVTVRDKVVDTINNAIMPHIKNVPDGVLVGTLSSITPVAGKSDRFVYTFTMPDGDAFQMEGTSSLIGARAVFDRGRFGEPPAIGFIHFATPTDQLIVGDLYHEITHAVRRKNSFGDDAWGALVGHAESSGILEMEMGEFKDKIGANIEGNVNDGRTILEYYLPLYSNHTNMESDIEEESVAHMVQLYYHGALPDTPPHIAVILDSILDGSIWRVPQDTQAQPSQLSLGLGEGANDNLAAVQKAKTRLSALHNLSAENLAFADRMGGIAAPSVAVVKEGMGVDGFGEITLIGRKDIGDPAQNPVFDADAWTVRFPRPEYRAVPSKKAQPFVDRMRPYVMEFRDTGVEEAWDRMVNRPDPERAVSVMLRDKGMQGRFLREVKGVDIKPVVIPAINRGDYPWADTQAFRSFLATAPADWYHSEPENPEQTRASLARAIADAIDEYVLSGKMQKPGSPQLDAQDQAYFRDLYRDRVLGEAGDLNADPWRVWNGGARLLDQTTVDPGATREILDDAMKPYAAEYKTWVESQIVPLYGEPRIKVGGKLAPFTLDNILKVMTGRRTVTAQEDHMTFGEGKARAASAKQFGDLESMRNYADWQMGSESEVNESRDKAKALMEAWRNDVVNYNKYVRANSGQRGAMGSTWGALDGSMRALAAWAKRGRLDASSLRSALAKEDFSGMPDHVLQAGVEAGKAFLEAPVPYFESKPQRAVQLSEFAGAVVPANTDPATLAILEKHGLPYQTYDKNSPNAQAEAAAKFAQTLARQGKETLFAAQRNRLRDQDALGYYSHALEAARSLKQAKGTPEQMLAQLRSAGVKQAEIEATNLPALLDGKKSITRDEIVAHLEATMAMEDGDDPLFAVQRPAITQTWGPKWDIYMGQQYRMAEAGGDLSTMYDILSAKLAKASIIEPDMRAAMQQKLRELYDDMGPEGRAAAGIMDVQQQQKMDEMITRAIKQARS